MRIAYIGTKGLPPRGGADRVVEALVSRLSGLHEITVYCSSRYTPPDLQIPNVRLVRVPCLSGKHSHMTTVDLIAACHAVTRGDYDLIHMHNIEASFVLPLLKMRYKVVSTAHGWPYLDEKWNRIARTMIRFTEKPFALMSDAATSVCSRYAEYFEQKHGRSLTIIPNGVESFPVADRRAAAALLQKIGIPRDRPFILFAAGRIVPLKGCHLLIDAHRRVDPDMPLLVIGDVNQKKDYSERLRAAANGRVHFHPLVPQATLMGLLSLARTFVFPSTREGMSMMLLEAASLGVPIISSDIPENREVLGSGGVYFESGNLDDLTRVLTWGLSNLESMTRIANDTKNQISRKLSWDRIASQYEQIYYAVAESRESERTVPQPGFQLGRLELERAPHMMMKILAEGRSRPHSRSVDARREADVALAEECLAEASAQIEQTRRRP